MNWRHGIADRPFANAGMNCVAEMRLMACVFLIDSAYL